MMRVLILGGTTEAAALARALAEHARIAPVLSLAGRTQHPALPPIPYRIGGFGGSDGLAAFLHDTGIAAVIDATHPFATRISAHAALACGACRVPLARLSRPAWRPQAGDRWMSVPDLAAAAAALGGRERRVLLTTGRLGLAAFRAAPQHRYLVRTIDPPDPADLPLHHRLVLDRGPFDRDREEALMRDAAIEVLVTKNSGGTAAAAKLEAARALGLTVVVMERPAISDRVQEFHTVESVLGWLGRHRAPPAP